MLCRCCKQCCGFDKPYWFLVVIHALNGILYNKMYENHRIIKKHHQSPCFFSETIASDILSKTQGGPMKPNPHQASPAPSDLERQQWQKETHLEKHEERTSLYPFTTKITCPWGQFQKESGLQTIIFQGRIYLAPQN